jgi:hypothetical protein
VESAGAYFIQIMLITSNLLWLSHPACAQLSIITGWHTPETLLWAEVFRYGRGDTGEVTIGG